MQPRASDQLSMGLFSAPGGRDYYDTFRDRAPLHKYLSSGKLHVDNENAEHKIKYLESQIRKLTAENNNLKIEVIRLDKELSQSETQCKDLSTKLSTLNKFAVTRELSGMGSGVATILSSLAARLAEQIANCHSEPGRTSTVLVTVSFNSYSSRLLDNP
eukprot:GHVN01002318.1.p1 GENE.GHVN01002318.1~~GHVN01002318.1.p1  ORF type:complete len:159 (+),score=7.04 GHVN01002318.1:290-766(+)